MENVSRNLAITWWNKLSFEQQWEKIVQHKEKIIDYPDRSPDTLTGREIEYLYSNPNI